MPIVKKKLKGPSLGSVVLGGIGSFGMTLAKALKAQSGADWDKNPQWLKDITTRPKDAMGSKDVPVIAKDETVAPDPAKPVTLADQPSAKAEVLPQAVAPVGDTAEALPVKDSSVEARSFGVTPDESVPAVSTDMNDMNAGWNDSVALVPDPVVMPDLQQPVAAF